MALPLRDTIIHYGRISRAFHWAMALLFAWQFTSVAARVLFEDSAFDDFMWTWHRDVGVLLFTLLLLRGAWGLLNLSRRPPSVSVMAKFGHLALYALMLVVPLVALLRQYGSGRSLSAFAIPLMPGFEGPEIEWMVALGSIFHGLLGWTLLVLILGHVAMVAIHRRYAHQDVLTRMAGTPSR